MADLFVTSFNTESVKQYDGTTGVYKGDFVSSVTGGLFGPSALAFDAAGNLYVASQGAFTVRQYNSTGGFLKVFATGNGLASPKALVFDANGFLYISSATTILRWKPTGVYDSVFAQGNGLGTPYGLAFGADGNFYTCNVAQGTGNILRWTSAGVFLNIFATTNLTQPQSLVQLGELWFVADFLNNTVQNYTAAGNYIDLYATARGLSHPTAIAIGPDGNFYVACSAGNVLPSANSSILRYDGNTGAFIDVFASGGGLDYPTGLVFH